MYCKKCGAELPDRGAFCPKCGAKRIVLTKTYQAEPSQPSGVSDQSYKQTNSYQSNNYRSDSYQTNSYQSNSYESGSYKSSSYDSGNYETSSSRSRGISPAIYALGGVIVVLLAAIAFLLSRGGDRDTEMARNDDTDLYETTASTETGSAETEYAETEYAESEYTETGDAVYSDAAEENTYDVADNNAYVEEVQQYDDGQSEFIFPYSDTQRLSRSDLVGLSQSELRIARNEIYARRGRRFRDEDLQRYFDGCSWYYGTIDPDSFTDSMLTEIEHDNVYLIVEYEEEKGYR